MTTVHRTDRVSKPALGLILAGLFIFHPAYAEITDPTVPTDIVAIPFSDAAPYDPFANSEQPVEIDPALIPPPAE